MITLHDKGVFLSEGALCETAPVSPAEGRRRTMAWNILQAHSVSGDPENLKIRFDAMISHDITYVGIIQQARCSGMKEFPVPYALTNCHNSHFEFYETGVASGGPAFALFSCLCYPVKYTTPFPPREAGTGGNYHDSRHYERRDLPLPKGGARYS